MLATRERGASDHAPRSAAPWLAALLVSTAGVVLLASTMPSPLLPALPRGVGPLPGLRDAADALGVDDLSRGAAVAVGTALAVLAVVGFAGALSAARRGRLSTRAVLGWSAVLIALVTLAPPLLSRDVSSYAIYGRIWAVHGANPYLQVPGSFPGDPFRPAISAEWVDTPSVYGPAFTLLSGAAVRAFPSPGGTVGALKVVSSMALLATALVAASLGRRRGPDRSTFAAAAVGLNPVLLFHSAGCAHNDVLVGLAVAGALLLWERGRRVEATATLVLGAMVKVVAAIPWAIAVVRAGMDAPGRARPRTVAAHVGVAAGLGLVLFLPFGLSARTFRAFAGLVSRQGWAAPTRLLARGAEGLGRAISGPSLADVLSTVVRVGFLALFAAGFVLLVLRARDLSTATSWCLALLLFSLCAAYLLPWYVAWFAPLLGVTRSRLVAGVGLALCALLALTGIPAEPSFAPGIWSNMVVAVHYVAAPVALGLLVALVMRGRALVGRGAAALEDEPG